MRKTIVLLSGKAGVGKDTFAAMLGSEWERVSFADALKEQASTEANLPLGCFHDRGAKDRPMLIQGDVKTPRELLIDIGDRVRRENENHWVDIVSEKIKESKNTYFVVTDWRFPHEKKRLAEIFEETAEIHTVRIVGSSCIRSSHDSECSLDSCRFDSVIVNRSTLDALQERARLLRAKVGEPAAVASVFEELLPKAKNLCRKHVRIQSSVEDAAYEALYEVLRQLKKKFNFSCSLWTFAYKIIYFNSQNFRRRRETYDRTFSFFEDGVENLAESGKSDLHSPFLGKKISESLSKLSSRDRMLFDLRCEGCKHSEIGEQLGIKENYSRRRLYTIYRKLRKDLGDIYSEFI